MEEVNVVTETLNACVSDIHFIRFRLVKYSVHLICEDGMNDTIKVLMSNSMSVLTYDLSP